MSNSLKKNEYNKSYYEKNKEKWFTNTVCIICGGKYNPSTKYNHFKTKKHIMADKDNKLKELQNKDEEIQNKNDIIAEKDKQLKELQNKINIIKDNLK